MKQLGQWRTVVVAVLLGAGLGFCFSIAIAHQNDMVEKMFASLCWAYVITISTLAGRSALQAAAGGSGLRGAFSAIMTDTKPGEPAPAAESVK